MAPILHSSPPPLSPKQDFTPVWITLSVVLPITAVCITLAILLRRAIRRRLTKKKRRASIQTDWAHIRQGVWASVPTPLRAGWAEQDARERAEALKQREIGRREKMLQERMEYRKSFGQGDAVEGGSNRVFNEEVFVIGDDDDERNNGRRSNEFYRHGKTAKALPPLHVLAKSRPASEIPRSDPVEYEAIPLDRVPHHRTPDADPAPSQKTKTDAGSSKPRELTPTKTTRSIPAPPPIFLEFTHVPVAGNDDDTGSDERKATTATVVGRARPINITT